MAIKLLSVCEGDVSMGLIGNIFASVAEWESEVNGQRTKDALRQKYSEGWWPGWAQIGYKNVKKGGKRIVEIDPVISRLVKETFELYSTGNYSYLGLCAEMYKKGFVARNGKMFTDSSLQQLLTNPFYYGLMRWGGMERMGKHKPIISKALFEKCQYTASKHRQFVIRERKYDFLLRGMAFCPVHNSRFTAEWHFYHNERFKKDKIGYYHCHFQGGCPGSYISVDDLEQKVANLFKKFQFSQEFIDLVTQKVKEHFDNGRDVLKTERQVIVNKRKVIEQTRNKLEDLLVEGTIGRDIFKRQHAKLQDQIEELDIKLGEIESRRNLDISLLEEVLALTRNIYKTYKEAPPYLKKHYLRFFFEAIYIKDKKISKVVETPVFATLRRQNNLIIRRNLLLD